MKNIFIGSKHGGESSEWLPTGVYRTAVSIVGRIFYHFKPKVFVSSSCQISNDTARSSNRLAGPTAAGATWAGPRGVAGGAAAVTGGGGGKARLVSGARRFRASRGARSKVRGARETRPATGRARGPGGDSARDRPFPRGSGIAIQGVGGPQGGAGRGGAGPAGACRSPLGLQVGLCGRAASRKPHGPAPAPRMQCGPAGR